MALRELRAAPAGSDHQLAWARFFAGHADRPEDFELLEALLEGGGEIDGLAVDADLRWRLLIALAAAGRADRDRIEAELERDRTASGHRHHAEALAARPTPEAKAEVWEYFEGGRDQPKDLLRAVFSGFARAGQLPLIAPYTERYFSALDRIWAERTIENASTLVREAFPELSVDEATLARADAWLAEPGHAPALRRLVSEARDDLARALRARAA
jgi:aminopeptidase N